MKTAGIAVVASCLISGTVQATSDSATDAPVRRLPPYRIGLPNCNDKYPGDARLAGREGDVILSFIVAKDGSVHDVKVSQSSGTQSLDDAAVSCIQTWKYSPETVNGEPVEAAWWTKVGWRLIDDHARQMFLPNGYGGGDVMTGNSYVLTTAGALSSTFCTDDGFVRVVHSSSTGESGNVVVGETHLNGSGNYSLPEGNAQIAPGCYTQALSDSKVEGTASITSTVWFHGHDILSSKFVPNSSATAK